MSDMVQIGYVYCFSNPSMIGIYKIGYTTKTPEERLKQANTSTFAPPTEYIIELSVKVSEPYKKEQIIHKLFDEYRVNPIKEFFKLSLDKIKLYFVKKKFEKIEDKTIKVHTEIMKDEYRRYCINNKHDYIVGYLNHDIRKVGVEKPKPYNVKIDRKSIKKFCYKINTYKLQEEMRRYLCDENYKLALRDNKDKYVNT